MVGIYQESFPGSAERRDLCRKTTCSVVIEDG